MSVCEQHQEFDSVLPKLSTYYEGIQYTRATCQLDDLGQVTNLSVIHFPHLKTCIILAPTS